MKPAARLHLIRQREYRKDCPPGHQRPQVTQQGWTPGGTQMGAQNQDNYGGDMQGGIMG